MSEPLRVLDYEPLPHQWRVLYPEKRKRVTALLGGYGSGKTEALFWWCIQRSRESPPDTPWLLAANSYTQLFDVTISKFYEMSERFGVPLSPPRGRLPSTASGYGAFNLRVWNGEHWVLWWCRSLHKAELLSGIQVAGAACDELHLTKREAFSEVLARCRHPAVDDHPILVASTKDDPGSWMYSVFGPGYDAEKIRVIEAKTSDNHYLPDGYVETMRALYAPREFQRLVENRWVSMGSGQLYSESFDRAEHVTEAAEYDPALPVWWSHDFNIGDGKPLSSCLFQVKRGESTASARPVRLRSRAEQAKARRREEVHVFDEIILDTARVDDAVDELESRHPAFRAADVVVCGDASGRARDTRSKSTDYSILRDRGYTQQRAPRANPPIRERHNTVNALLMAADGDVRLRVHPRCGTVIEGLETVRLKGGASYVEQETRAQHVTTALGYGCCVAAPIRRVRIGSGRLLGFQA